MTVLVLLMILYTSIVNAHGKASLEQEVVCIREAQGSMMHLSTISHKTKWTLNSYSCADIPAEDETFFVVGLFFYTALCKMLVAVKIVRGASV